MIADWNVRLKECREKKGYKLKDMASFEKLDLSQQSLIKYEKGEVFPRINVLEKMCKIYDTSLEYILYGNCKTAQFETRSNSLVSIFMMLYSNKIKFDDLNSTLIILDKKLLLQIKALNVFKNNCDISSIDDFVNLINGIKKMEDDNN